MYAQYQVIGGILASVNRALELVDQSEIEG
jgi:hypothetical protein